MVLALRPDVSMVTTEDAIVLLNERSGRYWQLNQSGSSALCCLLDGHTPADVAQNLARSYGISEVRAAADVDALLKALRTAELVTR